MIQNNCFQDHSFLHQIQCSLEKIEDDDYSLIDFIKRHKLKFPKSKDVQYNLVGQPLNGQESKRLQWSYFHNMYFRLVK